MPLVKIAENVENASTTQADFIKAAGQLLATALKDEAAFANDVHAQKGRFKARKYKHFATKAIKEPELDEVIKIITEGREGDQQDIARPDRTLNIQVRLYPHGKGTVGSTTLGRQPVKPAFWFVERCIASKDGVSMARHLMHEWLHVAGFFHYPNNSARDDVPYIVGDVVRNRLKNKSLRKELSKELLQIATENELTAYLWEEAEEDVIFD